MVFVHDDDDIEIIHLDEPAREEEEEIARSGKFNKRAPHRLVVECDSPKISHNNNDDERMEELGFTQTEGTPQMEAIQVQGGLHFYSHSRISSPIVNKPQKMIQCVLVRQKNVMRRFSGKDVFLLYLKTKPEHREESGSTSSFELLLVANRERRSDQIRIYDVDREVSKKTKTFVDTRNAHIATVGGVNRKGKINFHVYDVFKNVAVVALSKKGFVKGNNLTPRQLSVGLLESKDAPKSGRAEIAYYNNVEKSTMQDSKDLCEELSCQFGKSLEAEKRAKKISGAIGADHCQEDSEMLIHGLPCYHLVNNSPEFDSGLSGDSGVTLQSSVKNIHLVHNGDRSALMKFGKVGQDRFVLDFQAPLTATMAMGIALSQFLV